MNTRTISITFPDDAMDGILAAFSPGKPDGKTDQEWLVSQVLQFVADKWKMHAEKAAFEATAVSIQAQIDQRAQEVMAATAVTVTQVEEVAE